MANRSVKKLYSDRRWYDDPGGVNPICNDCLHRHEFDESIGRIVCNAFPTGIPRTILLSCYGERDLTDECYNGIKFEKK